MKKTVIITAIALGLSITTLNARTYVEDSMLAELVKPSPSVSPFCASIAKGDFETVKKLIELGTDVNQKSNGLTPAMYAAKYNRVDILKLLVENGAKLNLKSDLGFSVKKFAELSNAKDALAYLESLES